MDANERRRKENGKRDKKENGCELKSTGITNTNQNRAKRIKKQEKTIITEEEDEGNTIHIIRINTKNQRG